MGRCGFSSSAGSWKIKIRTSSLHKANGALCHDEVRILIFDDPAELEKPQRPGSGSREGKLSNPRGRAARARCMNFSLENLRNPARELERRAGAMHQFPSGQVYSTKFSFCTKFSTKFSIAVEPRCMYRLFTRAGDASGLKS